jgi:group I intron endonuclease
MKKYFIYLSINTINNKKYIGKHYGLLNDDYFGSGSTIKRAINKYGKENFTRIILEECTEEELDQKEIYWINLFDAVNNKDFYNITDGGTGGNTIKNLTIEQNKDRSDKIKTWFKNLSPDEKSKLSKVRSENMKKIRLNSDIENVRITNYKKTMSSKTEEWKNTRYSNQKGKNHYCARKVNTPKGIFELASDAAKVFNLNVQTVLNRCKNPNFIDWSFVNES